MRRTLIVTAIAAAYLLFVFGKRWWGDSGAATQPPSSSVHPAYQGNELKVLNFLASPPSVRRGQAALLCYGVLNAETVRIQPEVEALKPSLARCVEVRPKRTTEYRLEAQGRSGAVVRATVVVEVR